MNYGMIDEVWGPDFATKKHKKRKEQPVVETQTLELDPEPNSEPEVEIPKQSDLDIDHFIEQNINQLRNPNFDLMLYISSGIFLIIIMELFVQLGIQIANKR